MSASMVGLIYQIPFGGMAAKAIAVKLADNSNDDGENIWPSKANVAEAVECSKRTVDKYVDLWLVLGILHLDELGGGRRKDEECRGRRRRKGRTNVYSFNLPLLYEMAAGQVTIDDLIKAAQERGELDADGWPTPEAVARAKGAADAPFEGAEPDGETVQPLHGLPADETVQPLHGSGDGKGCSPGKERVQLVQEKGAPAAPEPSLNHHRTPSQYARAGARDGAGDEVLKSSGRNVEDMLDRIALVPKRERVVDLILAPICKQRRFDAPVPEYALGELADQLAERDISDEDAKRIVARVLEKRRASFKAVDVLDAVKALTVQPDGKILITRKDQPEAVKAWLRHARARRDDREMKFIAHMLENHGAALVPSRMPPAEGGTAV